MEDIHLHVLIAFGAGVFVTLSPCGFTLLPAYIGYLVSDGSLSSRRVFITVLTVIGSLLSVIIVLGILLSMIGSTLSNIIPQLGVVAAFLVLVMGSLLLFGRTIHLMLPGILRVSRSLRGIAGAALFGISYGLAASSCTAPIFIAILSYALSSPSPIYSLGTVTAYGFGAGLPILLVGWSVTNAGSVLYKRLVKMSRYGSVLGGAITTAFGALLLIERLWSIGGPF